ncbi:hypothetical protein GCM10010319_41670 [Streptomyces blastmyceticus]|uniref:Uncharacterized protein n=1 Tax=Streptomyces blastmyceticus TaxID=68180 RepID=A0ABP3H452_9ACTN
MTPPHALAFAVLGREFPVLTERRTGPGDHSPPTPDGPQSIGPNGWESRFRIAFAAGHSNALRERPGACQTGRTATEPR